MALVSIAGELKKAQAGGYAVPLFDVFEMKAAQGLVAALEKKRAPGILAVYSSWLEKPGSRAFVRYLCALAEDAAVPISVMLDHGADYAQCVRALDYGCTDLMYDGSGLSLAENKERTRAVVQAAHARGAAVEAELGYVGKGRDYADYAAVREGFTAPETVTAFAGETGVDFLAVAIGTAHGTYVGEPRIDYERLRKIRVATKIPLVLHGGSGLAPEQYRAAIVAGVSKINISTNLTQAAADAIKAAAARDGSYFALTDAVSDAYAEGCERYLDLFRAAGTA